MEILHENIELFREAIKRRRIELGMTQQELAKKLGYKYGSTISKIESGINHPPYSKINIFAEALNVNPLELISWQEMSGRLFDGELK